MSVELGRIASFLSVALLAGLPAQEKPKTVDDLRKENAALRQQVKKLRAQLDAKTSRASKKRESTQVIIYGNQLTRDRQVRASLLQMVGRVRLADADYKKSVERLRRATQSLNSIKDPAKSRKIVNEIERALLDVRRALWRLEQAEKKSAQDPAERREKRPDSSVVLIDVPVLAVAIRLDLDWPIVSGGTDPKDQLFFHFRRF